MHLIDHIHPSQDQLEKLVSTYPQNEPVVMVNILKFKAFVAEEKMSGQDLYERYAKNVIPFLSEVGGKLLWRGKTTHTVIGDEDVNQMPQLFLLVKYPTLGKFIEMISNPEYQKAAEDRTMSLEFGGLYACTVEFPIETK